jgi:hypothetical protein
MAKDGFGETLTRFERWAKTARELSGSPDDDVAEMRLLLDMMRDYLDIASPARITAYELHELLLHIYPRKVVTDESETGSVIAAMNDFVTFLAETGQVRKARAGELHGELDAIADQLPGAVMNPANWGMARSIVTEMLADGVTPGDDAEVQNWIANYNASLAGESAADGYEEDIDLREAFGLPDEMPPVRLPPYAELAAVVRDLPLIARLRALAIWTGEDGREVTEDWDLLPEDIPAAAAAAGADPADLPRLWDLAFEADFVYVDDEDDFTGSENEELAITGETAIEWERYSDIEVLDAWKPLVAAVLSATLEPDDDQSAELNLAGHGLGLVMSLFQEGAAGIPVTEASGVFRETVTEGLSPADAKRAWQERVSAYGDPMRLLLARLAEVGVIALTEDPDDGELITLTPLGRFAVRDMLIECGVDVPLLPDVDAMTATDVLGLGMTVPEEEFDDVFAEWVGCRTAEAAARELLAAAAGADARQRMLAAVIVTEIGAAAEPAWRDCLDQLAMRSYAKAALAQIAGQDVPDDFTADDAAWMTIDTLAASGVTDVHGPHDPAEVALMVGGVVPPGQEQFIFEQMARLPHPDAADVLLVVGRYHPDKKLAKMARTAAHKAESRRPAR